MKANSKRKVFGDAVDGSMLMSICMSTLAVLPESSYRITAKPQLFTMGDGKTSRSKLMSR